MATNSNQPATWSARTSYAYSLVTHGMALDTACELAGCHSGERAALAAIVRQSRGAL